MYIFPLWNSQVVRLLIRQLMAPRNPGRSHNTPGVKSFKTINFLCVLLISKSQVIGTIPDLGSRELDSSGEVIRTLWPS
jgi:hypothetical protein